MEVFWQTIGPANSSWKICYFIWGFWKRLGELHQDMNFGQTCKKSEWLDFKFCRRNTWQSFFFWLHAEVNPWSTGVYCSLWRGDCAVFRRTTKEVALRLALGNIQVVESSSFFGFCWLKSFWNRYVICECIQIVVASRQWFLLLVFSIDNTYISFEQKFLMKIVTRDIFLLKQPIGWYGYENKMRKSCNWRTVIETIENESSLRKLVPKEMASNWQKLWKINLCPFSKALSKKTVTKFFPWTTKF